MNNGLFKRVNMLQSEKKIMSHGARKNLQGCNLTNWALPLKLSSSGQRGVLFQSVKMLSAVTAAATGRQRGDAVEPRTLQSAACLRTRTGGGAMRLRELRDQWRLGNFFSQR